MERNVGSTDALVRVLLGALLGITSLAILGDYLDAATILSPILGIAAIALLATGFTRSCGAYTLLGTRTN